VHTEGGVAVNQQNTARESNPVHFSVIGFMQAHRSMVSSIINPDLNRRSAGEISLMSAFDTARRKTDAQNPQVNR
jgi:hypothetical protein